MNFWTQTIFVPEKSDNQHKLFSFSQLHLPGLGFPTFLDVEGVAILVLTVVLVVFGV